MLLNSGNHIFDCYQHLLGINSFDELKDLIKQNLYSDLGLGDKDNMEDLGDLAKKVACIILEEEEENCQLLNLIFKIAMDRAVIF